MKKILTIVLLLFFFMPANAVLKEADLEQTLKILRTELSFEYKDLQAKTNMAKERSEQARAELISTMKKSEQNALMLYSQQSDYVFDLTYVCNEVTKLWREFKVSSMPFDKIITYYETDIVRYEKLRKSLQAMPRHMLSDEGKTNRSVCLTLATALENMIKGNLEQYRSDIENNKFVRERLEEQHKYAQERYDAVQQSIFVNGEQTYFTMLKHVNRNISMAIRTIHSKYIPYDNNRSQWGGRLIIWLFIIIFIYAALSIIISTALMHILVPRLMRKKWWPANFSKKDFLKKRPYIIMALTVIFFAVILAIIRIFISTQNFIIMASDLLVEFAWLMSIILVSLLVRIDSKHIKNGFKVYMPILIMGFLVILFRIILIPNILVNLIFPIILLLFMLWQWAELARHKDGLNKEDKIYSWITLFVFIFSTGSSWIGYTLFAVQVLIWWIMQLTCILTITFFYKILKTYGRKHYNQETPISDIWFYGFLRDVLLPVCGVYSIVLSIYWAAEVFDLSALCWKIFYLDFVNTANFKLSLMKLCLVLSLIFLFQYINKVARKALQYHFEKKEVVGKHGNRAVMGANALNILVWGLFIIITMNILRVGNTWLVVISGGLATGLGFASKDILENIYYGISLMAGRIHIGDMIEIDGIRGKVDDMNYTSTMIEAVDGSIIAFQNSQLFTKNYKNLTKNNGWEVISIPVGVAYGTNVNEAKQIIIDACMQTIDRLRKDDKDWIDRSRGITVNFMDFGASSIDLLVFAWVKVSNKLSAQDALRMAIYDSLNSAHVEIPFPQQDIHIKK